MSNLDYVIRVLPEAHELSCALAFEHGGDTLSLATPTWVPGAYGLMKYGRDLFDIRVEVNGAERAWKREGWQGIRVEGARGNVRVTWKAAAYDPAWGELSGLVDHAYAVLRATRYLYPIGPSKPAQVKYELPAGWALHHPAGAKKLGDFVFEYPSFAALLDAPVVCGTFETRTRTLHGTAFHHVFLDRAVGFDSEVEGFLDALMRVADEAHRVFGKFPFDDYTYVFSHSPAAHWGLEHADSTMIGLGENLYIDAAARMAGVRVCAHELFHAWNVCRLKPEPLGALDVNASPAIDSLWVAEGVTRYYEFVLGCRAKEITPEQALSNIINYWRYLNSQPAWKRVSALDSSRTTFLNHNKYPGSINSTIDYYDAGMLIAFDLDASLRERGETLDARFAKFYAERVGRGAGYTHAEVLNALAPEGELRATLAREIEQPGPTRTPEVLERLGFKLEKKRVPYLGLVLAANNAGPEVANVLDDAPAGASGIAPTDVIQRVDGFPFSLKALLWTIAHRDRLRLTVLRGHRTLEFDIPVAQREDFSAMSWNGTDAQLERVRAWLGRPDLAWKAGQAIPLTSYDNFHGVQTVI